MSKYASRMSTWELLTNHVGATATSSCGGILMYVWHAELDHLPKALITKPHTAAVVVAPMPFVAPPSPLLL